MENNKEFNSLLNVTLLRAELSPDSHRRGAGAPMVLAALRGDNRGSSSTGGVGGGIRFGCVKPQAFRGCLKSVNAAVVVSSVSGSYKRR